MKFFENSLESVADGRVYQDKKILSCSSLSMHDPSFIQGKNAFPSPDNKTHREKERKQRGRRGTSHGVPSGPEVQPPAYISYCHWPWHRVGKLHGPCSHAGTSNPEQTTTAIGHGTAWSIVANILLVLVVHYSTV